MSPPHHHPHDDPRPAAAWARRLALLLLIPAALLTAVGMLLLLWPHDTPEPAAASDGPRRVFGAVAGVAPQPCPRGPEETPLDADSAPERSPVRGQGMTMVSSRTETEILVSRPVAGPLMRAPSVSWNRELWAAQMMTPSRGGLTCAPRWGQAASNARNLPGSG